MEETIYAEMTAGEYTGQWCLRTKDGYHTDIEGRIDYLEALEFAENTYGYTLVNAVLTDKNTVYILRKSK